jgi:PAP2 superfamily protein
MTSPPVIAGSSTADRSPDESARHRRWLIGVWAVVALFALVTALRSHQVGVPLRDPEGAIFRWRIAKSLILFGALVLVDASIRTGRPGWTIARAGAEMRRRWPKDRLAIALSGLLAYHLVYLCYRNIKSWVAFRDVHDDTLLRVDQWLFFGHSPAALLHDLFGEHLAAYALAGTYRSFAYLVSFSLVASLVFAPRIRDGYVLLVSAMWVWILGVGSYYLIPAIGPFHSEAQEFTRLPHTAITETQAEYMTERAQLLHHPAAGDSFSSISAFASLHIAFTFMVLLMLRYYGFRLAVRVMSVYLVAVFCATVYFGWHFAVDDVAGLVVALLAVLFGRLMIQPQGRGSP